MSPMFHAISDARFDFIEVELRNELRTLIMKAGRKKVVFVEGYDDKIIFDIVYKGCLGRLHFIDTSMEQAKRGGSCETITGGCETVKNLLKKFVSHLPNEKHFYGVIDRDLNLDEEIESEKSLPCYDGRLFIFFERYTLENYFIETDILCDFLHDKSMDIKRLIPLLSDEGEFSKYIAGTVDEISDCLTRIGAANLTIRSFDDEKKFLERTINCAEIEERLLNRLNDFPENDVICQFNCFETFIRQNNGTQKFASGKEYFSYQFNQHLKSKRVDIQLNNHKSELAKILKEYLSDDFRHLLSFIGESPDRQ